MKNNILEELVELFPGLVIDGEKYDADLIAAELKYLIEQLPDDEHYKLFSKASKNFE